MNQANSEKMINKAKAKKLREKERAKKLKLREKEKKAREKAKAKKILERERAKKLRIREQEKKLKERERAKKLKLREKEIAKKLKMKEAKAKAKTKPVKLEKVKLEKVKKPVDKQPKQNIDKPEKPAKNPELKEAKKLFREAKARIRTTIKKIKKPAFITSPAYFTKLLKDKESITCDNWIISIDHGAVNLKFIAPITIPLSEEYLKSGPLSDKCLKSTTAPVQEDHPKENQDELDKAIEESCPVPAEVLAALENSHAEEAKSEDLVAHEIVPAGDLYGSDGNIDEEDLKNIDLDDSFENIDLDDNPENMESDEPEDDYPDVPDYRDEQDNDLVDNRREFYESYGDDMEPLDD
jgi:hypothetical protein